MASLITNSIKNAVDGLSSAFLGAGLGTPSYIGLNTTSNVSLFPSAPNLTPVLDTPLPYNAVTVSGGISLVPTGATANLSSASGSGFVITYTYATPGANTYSVGQVVSIVGFGQGGYNITSVVTTASANNFTLAGSQTGGSTGTGIATQLSTRILASRTGVYQIDGTFLVLANLSAGSTGTTFVYLRVNNVVVSNSNRLFLNFGNATAFGFASSWTVALNSGDFVELVASFVSGNNITSDVFTRRIGAGSVPDTLPAQISIQQIA